MSKLYTCEECGGEFTKRELNWDGSDHTDGVYYCRYNFSLFIHQPAHWAGFWRFKETIKP